MKRSSQVVLTVLVALLVGLIVPRAVTAQTATISGRVTSEAGTPLSGVQIVVNNTASGAQRGGLTRQDGRFLIAGLAAGGVFRIEARAIGYQTETVSDVRLGAGENRTFEFVLKTDAIDLEAIEVFASRAKTRETPVAFTDVPKAEIQEQLGSRDVPMILNTTPGVYATQQGGGAGDARINIRGFDQRNVAVMINGVPVNDMESGWVYWSNWDGLGDATSSIQVQRGIGASNLAVPSIGGTMNIVTDAAALKPGVNFKQEYGSGNFLKSTLSMNSGLIGDKFAVSFVGVRKTADGQAERTWTDAWGYFGALSYQFSETNRVQAFVVGAPQQHGQRRSMLRIADWDTDYARELGITEGGRNYGRNFNPSWGRLSGANLQEYYWGGSYDLRDQGVADELVNYYHKPQANVNWYWTPSDRLNVTNVFYASFGRGGGSGRLGRSYSRTVDGLIDWQAVYNRNVSNLDDSGRKAMVTGLRNSVNHHNWFGWVGTVNYDLNDMFQLTTGVDARSYKGEHYRVVRNLFGADYYRDCSNRNVGCRETGLGDKVAYNNDGLVRWYGAFAQLSGNFGRLSTTSSVSVSNTDFKRVDYFVDHSKFPKETDWQSFGGYKVAGGANYNVSDAVNVFGNLGYISKPPTFNGVFDFSNQVRPEAANETVKSGELGIGYRTSQFAANVAVYNTIWDDRVVTSRYKDPLGEDYTFILRGLGAQHRGLEVDFRYKPIDLIEFSGAVSLADWQWMDDVTTTGFKDSDPTQTTDVTVYADGLKVGDAAQTQLVLGTTLRPALGGYFTLTAKHFADYYASFAPERRTTPGVRNQPWKVPAYTLLDVNAGYDLPARLTGGAKVQATLNVFNLLDEIYISDARDGRNSDAAGAQVYLGLPRTVNLGLKVGF